MRLDIHLNKQFFNNKTLVVLCFFSLLSLLLYAQDTPHVHEGQYKEHLSLYDVFRGPESNYMVCYPKSHRNYFLTGFGLSLTILVIVIVSFLLLKRSNRKIKAAHQLIEAKNEDLLAGIRYSLRIQKAIMPEFTPGINEVNCHIIYSPKDIVSGDTYWLAEVGNKKIVILADCTGHGISGAMLTMLFNTAIRKALYEYDLTEPSEILDSINSQIKNSLHQHEPSAISDSADMGILLVDETDRSFRYAGANINLFHYQKGNLVLLRGDKCTVGSVQEHISEKPATQTGTFNQGDYFVLYTDGIVDQVNAANKKLKRSGLEKILLDALAVNRPGFINNAMENWKTGSDQVDDMTLICYAV